MMNNKNSNLVLMIHQVLAIIVFVIHQHLILVKEVWQILVLEVDNRDLSNKNYKK
jgi:hypothetical protein